MKVSVGEIFAEIGAAATVAEQEVLLKKYNHPYVREIIQYQFDPLRTIAVTPGIEREITLANRQDGMGEASLWVEARRIYIFDPFRKPGIDQRKRDVLFIQFVEGLDSREAALMLALKDKALPGILRAAVDKVFPGLLPPKSINDVKFDAKAPALTATYTKELADEVNKSELAQNFKKGLVKKLTPEIKKEVKKNLKKVVKELAAKKPKKAKPVPVVETVDVIPPATEVLSLEPTVSDDELIQRMLAGEFILPEVPPVTVFDETIHTAPIDETLQGEPIKPPKKAATKKKATKKKAKKKAVKA